MKIVLKMNECVLCLNGTEKVAEMLVDVEEFKNMLDSHSPNILIEYLNERYGLGLAFLPREQFIKERKEVSDEGSK